VGVPHYIRKPTPTPVSAAVWSPTNGMLPHTSCNEISTCYQLSKKEE